MTTEDTLTLILARLDRIEAQITTTPSSPHLNAREAANYLNVSYSTFRKKATRIVRQPQTCKYRREDLDDFAKSLKPRKKR